MRTITIKIETDSEIPLEVLKDDIDRELSCCTYYGYFETVEISEMKLDDAPTADVVEVVRCKDCVHNPDLSDDDICPFVDSDGHVREFPNDDFFCKSGERRDDAKVH